MVTFDAITIGVAGGAKFVNTLLAVAEQTKLFVPVTVYVLFAVMVVIVDDPVVVESSIDGAHEYEAAPLADKVTLVPPHTVNDAGLTVTVGLAFIVIIIASLVERPQPPLVTLRL